MRLVVLNVLDPDSRQPAADALAAAAMPPMLRYAWRNATGLAQLFPLIQQAVGARPTVGGVIELVNEGFRKAAAAEPTDEVPDPVRGRRIGTTPP